MRDVYKDFPRNADQGVLRKKDDRKWGCNRWKSQSSDWPGLAIQAKAEEAAGQPDPYRVPVQDASKK